jgi:hypothetical protein
LVAQDQGEGHGQKIDVEYLNANKFSPRLAPTIGLYNLENPNALLSSQALPQSELLTRLNTIGIDINIHIDIDIGIVGS